MPFNISEFRSVVTGDDVLRKNRFLVKFNMPMGMMHNMDGEFSNDTRIVRELELWADKTSIPTSQLMKTHNLRYGYGVVDQRPISKTFEECNISFIVDGYAEKWKFFDKWTNMIFNTDMSDGITGRTGMISKGFLGREGRSRYQPYELAFKDEYITDLIIEVYNQKDEMVLATLLREAFPSGMGAMNFNWADKNSAQSLNVNFSFTDMFRLV